MNIWMYWENKPGHKKPAYLDLCFKTIHKNSSGFPVHVLNENTIRDYIPDIRNEIFQFPCIAHRADYIRAKLVYKYGGFWFDSDTILCNPIDRIHIDLLDSQRDFIGCGRPGLPSIGFLGGQIGSNLIEKWIEGMDEVISNSKDYKFRWTGLGYDILWKFSKDYPFYQYPFNICIPYYSNWKKIFFCTDIVEKEKYMMKITSDTRMICLYNAMFPIWFKNMTCEQILDEKYFISDLLRNNI